MSQILICKDTWIHHMVTPPTGPQNLHRLGWKIRKHGRAWVLTLYRKKMGVFPKGFADLFKKAQHATKDTLCSYYEPKNPDILDVEQVEVDPIQDLWGFCLLGCFAGRFPGLKAVNNMANNLKVPCTVLPHFNGWVIFQFENKEHMEKVLAGGALLHLQKIPPLTHYP